MVQESKKGVDGKAFVSALDACKTAEDVFNLLNQTMDKETLIDRVGHVNDYDLVNTMLAERTRCNIKLGYRTSHQDCANLAAQRYQKITGKNIKEFKDSLNKHNMTKIKSRNMSVPEMIRLAKEGRGIR